MPEPTTTPQIDEGPEELEGATTVRPELDVTVPEPIDALDFDKVDLPHELVGAYLHG